MFIVIVIYKLKKNMNKIINIFLFLYFLFQLVLLFLKIHLIVVQFLMKDILWYKHAKKTEEKWGAPIHLQLAFVKKESDFNWLAKPPRRKLFKVIPFKRPSSSFGYSQAVVGTWEQYKKETIIH